MLQSEQLVHKAARAFLFIHLEAVCFRTLLLGIDRLGFHLAPGYHPEPITENCAKPSMRKSCAGIPHPKMHVNAQSPAPELHSECFDPGQKPQVPKLPP